MNLEELRNKIDDIDNQLIGLLNARMQIVKEVGELKRASNSIVYRPEREKQIIERLCNITQQTNGLLTKQGIEAIFLEIFAVSRNLELPQLISYLGPEGSFTHQAAESRFGAISDYVSLPSIKSVFDSVDTKRVAFGVVPLENNQAGIVGETVDLFIEREVKIAAEIYMPIHFTLATTEDKVNNIKKIYSKDIAFSQCKRFLDEYFGDKVILENVDSTSIAAQKAAKEAGTAAICSQVAAKIYNLPILFDNIEDSTENRTKFLIISKDFVNQPTKHDKTSILLKGTNEPGSLVKLLNKFKDHSINLTKIESRPAKEGTAFNYWFIIDFDGHFLEENVQNAIKSCGSEVKWLGSYLKAE
jgi:chorismate mutase/prephenate dehydratase